MTVRIGQGFDVHPFSNDPARPLVLGGVTIPGSPGLTGHSDADVVAHAIIDALLGACGLGDIGQHFPDTDPRWKDADSMAMTVAVASMVTAAGYRVGNIDVTIVTESPRLAAHRPGMEQILAAAVGGPVSVKAKRAEGLGALGRGEGIACFAVALIERT